MESKPSYRNLEPDKTETSGLELGTSGNIRILRVLDRKLRINPDTPDLEWYIMCLGLVTVPKHYKPLFTLSRALSHSLPCSLSLSPVLSLTPNPRDPKPSLYS